MQIYLVGGRCRIACWDRPRGQGSPGGRRHGGADAGPDSPRWAETFRSFLTPNPAGVRPGAHRAQAGVGYTRLRLPCRPEVTLEQDCCAGILTINAIAEDEDGQLHDPPTAAQDLEARLLRYVSPALPRIPASCGWARFAARFHAQGSWWPRDAGADARDDGGRRELAHLDPGAGLGELEKLLGADTQIFLRGVAGEWWRPQGAFPRARCSVRCAGPCQMAPEIDTASTP